MPKRRNPRYAKANKQEALLKERLRYYKRKLSAKLPAKDVTKMSLRRRTIRAMFLAKTGRDTKKLSARRVNQLLPREARYLAKKYVENKAGAGPSERSKNGQGWGAGSR